MNAETEGLVRVALIEEFHRAVGDVIGDVDPVLHAHLALLQSDLMIIFGAAQSKRLPEGKARLRGVRAADMPFARKTALVAVVGQHLGEGLVGGQIENGGVIGELGLGPTEIEGRLLHGKGLLELIG